MRIGGHQLHAPRKAHALAVHGETSSSSPRSPCRRRLSRGSSLDAVLTYAVRDDARLRHHRAADTHFFVHGIEEKIGILARQQSLTERCTLPRPTP